MFCFTVGRNPQGNGAGEGQYVGPSKFQDTPGMPEVAGGENVETAEGFVRGSGGSFVSLREEDARRSLTPGIATLTVCRLSAKPRRWNPGSVLRVRPGPAPPSRISLLLEVLPTHRALGYRPGVSAAKQFIKIAATYLGPHISELSVDCCVVSGTRCGVKNSDRRGERRLKAGEQESLG